MTLIDDETRVFRLIQSGLLAGLGINYLVTWRRNRSAEATEATLEVDEEDTFRPNPD